jgi:hypothetical protein
MKKSFTLFVIFLVIISIYSCQTHEEKQSQKTTSKHLFLDGNDTLRVEIIRIDSMKRVFVFGNDSIPENLADTIDCPIHRVVRYFVDANNYMLWVKSEKIFDYIKNFLHKPNFTHPAKIDARWIKEIEAREEKHLSFGELPSVLNPDKDTNGCGYTIQDVNIDNDVELEKVITLYYIEEGLIMAVFLDSSKGEWVCKYRIEFSSQRLSEPELTIIDRGYKILAYEYEANTGTSYYNTNTQLYKIIDNKIYGIIEFVSTECTYYKFDNIWEELSSEVVFINDDTLRIDYTYNLFTFKDVNDKRVPDVYILKDKKESVYFKWEKSKREFIQYYSTNKQLERKNEVFEYYYLVDFTEMYKSEIENIRMHGSAKQRRAFREQ